MVGVRPQTRLPPFPPKIICMRIQRLPCVSPSPVQLCSTIPPITHTLLATSVAGLYELLAQADNRGSLGVLRRYLRHSNSEIAVAKDRGPQNLTNIHCYVSRRRVCVCVCRIHEWRIGKEGTPKRFHCVTLHVTKATVNIQHRDRRLVDCNNLKPALRY